MLLNCIDTLSPGSSRRWLMFNMFLEDIARHYNNEKHEQMYIPKLMKNKHTNQCTIYNQEERCSGRVN